MTESKELQALHDIHLPTAVSWWPPAPGWYVLMVAILVLLTLLAWFAYQRHRRERYKREALVLLANYEHMYQQDQQCQRAAGLVSDVLRRVAVLYYPREVVAGLQGQAWSDFLTQTSQGIDFKQVHSALVDIPYQREVGAVDLSPLFACARAWIKQRGVLCSN